MNAKINIATFTYARTNTKVKLYDKEYELPVRTSAFCDRQDVIDRELADTSNIKVTADLVNILRRGVALFIGADEAERLYPTEGQEEDIDIDEIMSCYNFLKHESLNNLKEHNEKYAPRSIVRR